MNAPYRETENPTPYRSSFVERARVASRVLLASAAACVAVAALLFAAGATMRACAAMPRDPCFESIEIMDHSTGERSCAQGAHIETTPLASDPSKIVYRCVCRDAHADGGAR